MSALKSAILGLLLIPETMTGQVVGTTAPSTGQLAPSAQQSVPEPTSVISQTGLLPLFAVDMKIDPSWVDGDNVPSKSAQFSHSGVNDTFQQTWDALKSGGFNMIRFSVEVKDSQAAARLANLCIWAKANNVSLIPILKGGGTKQKDKSLTADDVSAFLSGVVSRIRGSDAQQSAAYTQIAYFQIEGAMNHTGYYPKITPDAAQATLLGASDALRKAETQALQGTGVQPTPILISASFDYELIRQGAIAGVALDPSAEQKAQASLKQFLAPFANAANIEAINVEWFPRSISSGDVDHFASLLRELKGALPAKQLILTTGFSSAFNPPDQQAQFFTLAFSNLSDFRASDGASSPFLGAIFRQAFRGASADVAAPAGSGDPSQWSWSQKAQLLSQMWSLGGKSDELSWWLNKVVDNMGLLALQPNGSGGMNVVPLPAEQAFQQISATVAQVSKNVATTAATHGADSSAQSASALPPSTATGLAAADPSQAAQNQANPNGAQSFVSPGGASSMTYGAAPAYAGGAQGGGPSGGSPYQQLLFTILQQFTTQITNSLVARLTAPRGQGMQSQYAAQTQYSAQPQYAAIPSTASQNFASATQQQTGYGTPIDRTTTQASYPSAQPSSQTGSASSGTNTFPSQTPAASATPSGAGATSGTAPNPSQQAPVGATPTNAVALGAQDVTVDSTNVTLGQTVHITAQVHNTSADQEISGLMVRLVDPANATANQAMQSGVSVPRLGTTPVQLSWTPASPSTRPYQISLQVLDATGTQVAYAAVPAITIVSASAGGSGGSTTSAQSAPVQPQIAFFGIANSNSIPSPGQLPSLLMQVNNPANVPTQAAQVQLFVDGTPGQTQSLGPLLPKQSRSVVFTGIAASPGNHAATVTVQTADGATASASASANAPSASVASSGAGANANPASVGTAIRPNSIAVRSGAPTKFTIGPVSQSATSLNVAAGSNSLQANAGSTATGPNVAPALKSSAPKQTTPAASAAPSAPTTAQAPSTPSVAPGSPSTNPNLPSRPTPTGVGNVSPASTGVKAVLPQTATTASTNNTARRPGPSDPTAPVNAPPAAVQVRTITPGAASSASAATGVPANNGNLVRPGPTGSSVPANAPASAPQVRTITPGVASSASAATGVPANNGNLLRPGPTGSSVPANAPASAPQVRTITPGNALPSASANSPVRPGPAGTAAAITPGNAASRPSAPRATTQGNIDLTVSPGDIRFSPALRSGQATTFTALIRNNCTAGAQGASVVFKLLVNGRQAAISAPVSFSVPARGTFLASWSTTIPASQQIQIVVSVAAKGDKNPNKQAALSLAVSH